MTKTTTWTLSVLLRLVNFYDFLEVLDNRKPKQTLSHDLQFLSLQAVPEVMARLQSFTAISQTATQEARACDSKHAS